MRSDTPSISSESSGIGQVSSDETAVPCVSCTSTRLHKFCTSCGSQRLASKTNKTSPGAHQELNLTQAVSYPFVGKNILNTLLLPTLVCALALYLAESEPGIACMLACVAFLPSMGYGWLLAGTLRNKGYDAKAPDWTLEGFVKALWDGTKLSLLVGAFGALSILPFILHNPSGQAATLADKQEHQMAIDVCSKRLKVQPYDESAYRVRAQALSEMRQYDKADLDLRKADSLLPADELARRSSKGLTPADISALRAANCSYLVDPLVCKKAVQLFPDYAWAYVAGAGGTDRNRSALDDYGRAINIRPNYAAAYRCRGDLNTSLGRYDKALFDYLKAASIEPFVVSQSWEPYLMISYTLLFVPFLPFLWGAVVQASETRRLIDLLNTPRAFSAGIRCYGKSLFVSMAVLIIFPSIIMALTHATEENSWSICTSAPVLVSLVFSSFHLVTQAFDDYRMNGLAEHGTVPTGMRILFATMTVVGIMILCLVTTAVIQLNRQHPL